MKLRLRGDTLRLRLTQGEVDQIGAGESVLEHTRFPDGSVFSYTLVPGTQTLATIAATEQGQQIRIEVAAAQAKAWANSTQVGLGGEDPLRIGSLEVLIEKDFDCVDPREGDDDLDTFPNPNTAGHGNNEQAG